MNRSKLGLVLAGFLLAAGMGSATVLDSFGVISGEADIEGPTFWVGSSSMLYLEKQDPGATATGDTFSYDFSNPSAWYDMNVDMYANVSKDSGESSNTQVDVKFAFEAFNENGDSIDRCEVVKEDIVGEEPDSGIDNQESANCSLKLGNNKVGEFEYMIEGNSTGDELNLQRYGDTRAEVNAQ